MTEIDHGDHHHPGERSDVELRARALEDLLVEKGIVDRTFIDNVVEGYAHDLSLIHI